MPAAFVVAPQRKGRGMTTILKLWLAAAVPMTALLVACAIVGGREKT